MRIIPYTGNIIRTEGNNGKLPRSLRVLSHDTVTFSGFMTGREFKNICGKYMTDLYTGEYMVADLLEIIANGGFKGPVSLVMERTKNDATLLSSAEAKLYNFLQEKAKLYPNINLSELVSRSIADFNSEILHLQQNCLNKIKTIGAELPQDYLAPFYKYMNNADRKIYGEPVRQEFSMKEFKYEINKLSEYITDKNLQENIRKFLKLMPESHNDFLLKPSKKGYTAGIDRVETAEQAAELIDAIRDLAHKTGYKKIEKLCKINIMLLKGEPTNIPFSNKGLRYDLKYILDGVSDEGLVNRIIDTTYELPTSENNLGAFLFKFKDMDENMIGTRIFSGDEVTVEHLHPASYGGSSYMINCALAKKRLNSKRGNMSLEKFLKDFPQKNQQLYVENLSNCVDMGLVPREQALLHVETLEEEGKIILDKSPLLRF